MKKYNILYLALSIVFISSCDLPKHYNTPVPKCVSDTRLDLEDHNQDKLIAKLKESTPSNYRYYFQTFLKIEAHTFMITNFRNETSCFDVKVLVDKWDKLEGMRILNGKSYPKELFDLNWEIISLEGREVVRYVDMHRIID